ncbi:MAG: 1-acyl-sn-glycerol-3-phosphate acyltransferase [Clostridia bacterium]|nr:1-acyl-sn-glycerol-3-phosphate acyltransferase [Clostridia bacterium]
MKEKKVVYYKDELNDEFSSAKITPRVIDEKYKYKKGAVWNFFSAVIQNVLSMPIKVGYAKIKFRIKYVGKEKLKQCKKTGYFVYANHTQVFADTFIPSIAIFPKRNFLIVNPENISVKPFGWLVELLGAIPVPGDKTAMKNFLDVIKYRISKKQAITIYPEAHIWPYYTKIRPFKSVSFKYPVELKAPVFCVTNTYKRRGEKGDRVDIVSYIDGPFYADESLASGREQKEELRNRIYERMVERSRESNFEVVEYVKKVE